MLKRTMCLRVLVGVVFLSLSAAEAGVIRRVKIGGGGGPGTATDWSDAYGSLQTALTAAVSTDQIWVAAGSYSPGGSQADTFFLKTGVAIYGGFPAAGGDWASRNEVAHLTTLSGGNTNYHVLTGSGTDSTAILDGFTISGGNANGSSPANYGGGMYNNTGSPSLTNCTFSGNTAQFGGAMFNENSSNPAMTNCTLSGNTASGGNGGGMYTWASSPTLTNCAFSGNSANNGGGIFTNNSSTPTLMNCTFRGNTASGGGGGGIYNNSSSPIVTLCTFSVNSACTGGAMHNVTSSPIVTSCTFSENTATCNCGGMYNTSASSPKLTHCIFNGNTSSGHCGGLYNNEGSNPTLTNCTFSRNVANGYGGGVLNDGATNGARPTLTNCTFSGNTASGCAGGMCSTSNAHPTVTNCIFWGDSSEIADIIGSSTTITFSDIQGGGGSINANPLFVRNPGSGNDYGNLRLQSGSPCLNTGSNAADIDSVTGGVQPLPAVDADGNTRIINATVDMGAYELPDANEGRSRLYVDDTATGANTGKNWTDAYTTLQHALNVAAAYSVVTEIWVAEGTYKPDQGGGQRLGDRLATIQLKSGVAIHGGFAGDANSLSERAGLFSTTFLSGDIGTLGVNTDNSYHVVKGVSGAIFDGFTVTAGNANGAVNPDYYGGGMYNLSCNPTVTNCNFSGNSGDYGSGMANVSVSSPTVTDCTFSGNTASQWGGAMYNGDQGNLVLTNCTFSGNTSGNDGGAMHNNDHSNPTLTNCTFSGNTTSGTGGGMHNISSSSPTLTNCTFSANTGFYGGGMVNINSSNPTLNNCTFTGNSATSNYGGGMNNYFSSPTLNNCIFSGNTATNGSGGGLALENGSGTATLTNCTFSGNSASNAGGIYNQGSMSLIIVNCILWGNTPSAQIAGSASVTYSCVQNGATGSSGNINVDPLFVAAPNNLRLQSGSPCINTGNNGAPNLHDPDLDGNSRIFNVTVDMGAYEYFPDCNGNGVPDSGEAQSRLYVDDSATGGSNTGEDWTNAYTTLQNALCIAAAYPAVTEIWVADGIYRPDQGGGQTPSNRSATFQLRNGVAIYGGFAGTETSLSERAGLFETTILSGDLAGDDSGFTNNGENSYHVVTGSGVSVSAVDHLDGFTISGGNANGNDPLYKGGGMYNADGSPTLNNCTFSENSADAYGGGMYNTASSPTLTDCTFVNNNTSNNGGGMYNTTGSPMLTSCAFIGNTAGDGGGMYNVSATNTPTVTNCIFSGNTAASRGGGMRNDGSNPTLTNCSFSGNSAAAASIGGGGMFNNSTSNPTLTNCILWGNTATSGGAQIEGSAVVNHSGVQGGWAGGTGNINLAASPSPFADVDLRLSTTSPCIDVGNNTTNPVLPATDLDGNPRIADGDGDGTATVDMGAYESPPPPIGSCCLHDGTCSITAQLNCTGTWTLDGVCIPNICLQPDGSCCDPSGACSITKEAECADSWTIDGVCDPNPCIADCNGNSVPDEDEAAARLYVDANAGGLNTGESWANAYAELQSALCIAAANSMVTEIWVAAGSYMPDQGGGQTPGDRHATFQLINGVAIKGGYKGGTGGDGDTRDINLYQTILSGDLLGDDGPNFANNAENSYHVVNGSNTDDSAAFDGFTISGGNANGSDGWDSMGGGMFMNESDPTLTHCTFSGNRTGYDGGGMFMNESNPTLTHCTFSGNSADADGGGLANWWGFPTLANCTFSGNSADDRGGGLDNENYGSATVINSTFIGNTTSSGGGGGMLSESEDPLVVNCTFRDNQGGGMFVYSDSPKVTNCVFWNNDGMGAIDQIVINEDTPDVDYSCNARGRWGGTGNFDADPLFADGPSGTWTDGAIFDPATVQTTFTNNIAGLITGELVGKVLNPETGQFLQSLIAANTETTITVWGDFESLGLVGAAYQVNDYHLLDGSPCINAGLSAAVPPGVTTDIDGEDRIQQCNVDMGVDETPYFESSIWTGGDGGSFSTPTNWDPPVVPTVGILLNNATSGDNRCSISAPGETALCHVTIGPSTSPWKQILQIDGGSALRISSSLNNLSGGVLRVMTASHVVVDGGEVTQAGEIEVRSVGAAVFDYPVTNLAGGKITLLGGTLASPELTSDAGATVTGTGTIDGDLSNDGQMSVIADLLVVGDLDNAGTIFIQNGILTVTGALTNSGTIIGGFGGRDGNDAAGLRMLGDFDLSIKDCRKLDLTSAVVQMAGAFRDGPQTFEVPATNRSSDSVSLPDASLFSIGTLRIGPTATIVRLVDRHRNSPAARRAGAEALYVQQLVIDPGATLDLAGLNVYCETISPVNPIGRAAGMSVIDTVGGGSLQLIRRKLE